MTQLTRKFMAAAVVVETPHGPMIVDPVMTALCKAFLPEGWTRAAPFIDEATTRRRAWALLDWLVRYYGPCVLAHPELRGVAEALCELPEVTPDADLTKHAHAWGWALKAAREVQTGRCAVILVPATLWAVLNLATTAAVQYAPNPETAAQADALVSVVMYAAHAGLNGVDAAHRAGLFEVVTASARAKLQELLQGAA